MEVWGGVEEEQVLWLAGKQATRGQIEKQRNGEMFVRASSPCQANLPFMSSISLKTSPLVPSPTPLTCTSPRPACR